MGEFWANHLKLRLQLHHVPVHEKHSAKVRKITTTSKTPSLTRMVRLGPLLHFAPAVAVAMRASWTATSSAAICISGGVNARPLDVLQRAPPRRLAVRAPSMSSPSTALCESGGV